MKSCMADFRIIQPSSSCIHLRHRLLLQLGNIIPTESRSSHDLCVVVNRLQKDRICDCQRKLDPRHRIHPPPPPDAAAHMTRAGVPLTRESDRGIIVHALPPSPLCGESLWHGEVGKGLAFRPESIPVAGDSTGLLPCWVRCPFPIRQPLPTRCGSSTVRSPLFAVAAASCGGVADPPHPAEG